MYTDHVLLVHSPVDGLWVVSTSAPVNALLRTWVYKYLFKSLLTVLLGKSLTTQEQGVFEGQFLMNRPSPPRARLTDQKSALLTI